MEVIDFSKSNSIINLYMSELRDKNYQKNRLLFRHNIKRVGEMMAYELSKTLEFKPKTITTPLGTIDIPLPKEDLVVATVCVLDYLSMRVSSMCSTMLIMPLYRPIVCTRTANIPRWVFMLNIWLRRV